MKNIITILLILIVPIVVYLFLSKDNNEITANAIETNKPTIITFSSTMCIDCQRIKPIINELENKYKAETKFIYLNATEQNENIQENIKKYSITLVPTIIMINKRGEIKTKIEGFTEKETLEKKIKEIINE